MLDEGTSKLFDALSAILGLEELTRAQETLAEARKAREKAHKEAGERRDELLERLKSLEDARARVLVPAIEKKDWGLDAMARLIERIAAPLGLRQRAELRDEFADRYRRADSGMTLASGPASSPAPATEFPPNLGGRQTASGRIKPARPLDQRTKLRIVAHHEVLPVGLRTDRCEGSHGAPLARHDQGLAVNLGRVLGERFRRLGHLDRLHPRSTSWPPMITRLRTLTPTARTVTTGEGPSATSKYTRRSPILSSQGATGFARSSLRFREGWVG
jgi:hypothetical protein